MKRTCTHCNLEPKQFKDCIFADCPMIDKDLFGEKLPITYFKAVPSKNDDGWLMMYCCGKSGIDNKDYVVTTEALHADEVPDECNDAKTFSELVAKLLNEHYNK